MKNFFKVSMCAAALAASASFAGQYPFPQNMKHPYGTTVEYAVTDSVKSHYNAWKAAWYNASNGWVYAPEGTCSTVSEAIAYGMLITVYMDDESTFQKLYSVWTGNGGNGGAGMNWRIGCNSENGNGSATDADEDAALALAMASKQWNNTNYLNDAKSLINWIAQHDFNGTTMKPGSNWDSYLNPSYVMLGHYRLFEQVTGDSKWSNIRQTAAQNLLKCQDSKTGLVGDWCDLSNNYKPAQSGQVTNDLGYYDDASRTPWRTAWAYYWYGDSDAKKFNENVVSWLIEATHTASGVNSGYKYVGGTYEADKSTKRNFVSSSFSGGLGLATSSIEGEAAAAYLASTYKALVSLTSCARAENCGENSNPGEKYYPATLNVLYLLLMTGNMPNFFDIDKFAKFNPDPSKAPSISDIDGVQQATKDSTVGVSGFWNWGAYHDKYGIGTIMTPDSGTSPLYKRGCEITADASMEIGEEPKWTAEAAAAGTLKYPSAGIAMSFLSDDKKGVDFTKLGVKAVRVTMKASGPIRMAVLNEKTKEAGAEPGVFVPNSSDYKATTYDLTPEDCGFKGFTDSDAKYPGGLLDWVDYANAPSGQDILTAVKGLKWEVKDAKGGVGELSIKAVEFLDASGNVIDPVKITGITVPETQCGTNPGPGTDPDYFFFRSIAPSAKVIASGSQIQVLGAKVGSDYAVFNMQGKVVKTGKISNTTQGIAVANRGTFLVRVDGKIHSVTVK